MLSEEVVIRREDGPPWGMAPPWANYWQCNVGGESWWWQCEPVKHNGYWVASEGYVPTYAGRAESAELWWGESLRKRPGKDDKYEVFIPIAGVS